MVFFEGMQNAAIEIMPNYLKENFLKLTPDEDKLYNMFQKDSQRMINFEDWENKTLQNIKKSCISYIWRSGRYKGISCSRTSYPVSGFKVTDTSFGAWHLYDGR